MDIKTLEYLLAIDREGSISRAAYTLGMAQPALSLALSRVERELKLTLFKRSRSGMQATDAGRQFLNEAAGVVTQFHDLSALGSRLSAGLSGQLTIGFISSALYELLPRAISTFRAEHPDVQFTLLEMNSSQQLEALRDRRIDIGFSRSPVEATRYVREQRLVSSPLVAAVPEDFLPDADIAPLAAIVERGLILAPETQGSVRARVLHAIRSLGVEPRIVQEAHRGLTMLACVAAGLGIALLPRPARRVRFAGVRYCDIDPPILPTLDLSILWRPQARPQLADRYVDCVLRSYGLASA